MTDKTESARGKDNTRLRAVLEAYGADQRRWPAADREAFARHDLEAGDIAQTATEARELDALLARATPLEAGPGMAERVAARILDKPDVIERGNVVALATRSSARPGPVATAALLAASLVLGIFLGQAETLSDLAASAFLGDGTGLHELGNTVLGLQFSPDAVAEDLL